jgi:hypothetical protein
VVNEDIQGIFCRGLPFLIAGQQLVNRLFCQLKS